MLDNNQKNKVYIVGSSFGQNKLLADYIEGSIGNSCTYCLNIESVTIDEIKDHKTLILLDCKDRNWVPQLKELKKKINGVSGIKECSVALFNMNPKIKNKKEIIRLGISGIFYTYDTCDVLIKGIKNILKNDIWLTKELINKIFMDYQNIYNNYYQSELIFSLTFREKEIIKLLTLGLTNDMIADKLCVSIHTVKTHIYNIYRKIKVKNRLQAARWANQNLS